MKPKSIDESRETIHDFRPDKLRWGWNGLNFKRHKEDKKRADFKGIGNGIKKGNYVIIRMSEMDCAFIVEEIEYDTNPKDLFNCVIKILGEIEA